ncbi:CarD family transcriptional regulator, partial [Desulfovibrio sp. OttesenSCG-928-G15]|nr:CarD family transcriptional regulator [Desulfovibrio sp. OttesenSCG-928-G15]
GVIERLERQRIGGQEAEFYIIRIFTNNITVMVPVANAANVGLRTPCTAKEAKAVLKSLQDRSTFTGYSGQNWNRRYREYSERLKSSSLLDVGYVLKELILISAEKELSFGERRLLEQAMGLITSELSCVLKRDADDLKADIEGFYADVLVKQEKAT